MELTPAQKHLIRWLKVMGVQEDDMVGIMLLMDTPKKHDTRMCWMAENQTANRTVFIQAAKGVRSGEKAGLYAIIATDMEDRQIEMMEFLMDE